MALEMQTTSNPVSAINIRGINYNFHSIRLRQSRPLDWKLLNSLTTTDPQRDAVLTPETQRSGASFGWIRVRKPESGVGSPESAGTNCNRKTFVHLPLRLLQLLGCPSLPAGAQPHKRQSTLL